MTWSHCSAPLFEDPSRFKPEAIPEIASARSRGAVISGLPTFVVAASSAVPCYLSDLLAEEPLAGDGALYFESEPSLPVGAGSGDEGMNALGGFGPAALITALRAQCCLCVSSPYVPAWCRI